MINDKTVNALRVLSCDMINKANSGHPGIALGAAPIIYALYDKYLVGNPKDLKWHNRDRFILSAGHGSSLLYSLLHLQGVLPLKELKKFRQLGSKTPGHPEYPDTKGVEVTTGPLGQGIAMAVGMALGFSHLASVFNKSDIKLFTNKVYALCGDGDLQEGISYEATSLAGHLGLNNLVILYDSNDIQLDSPTNKTFSENIKLRFESQNWEYYKVSDGNNYQNIKDILLKIKDSKKPVIVEIKTSIGYSSSGANTNKVHGSPLGDDILNVRKNLNWEYKPFEIPKDVYDNFKEIYQNFNNEAYEKSLTDLKKYQEKYPEDYKKFTSYRKNKISFKVNDYLKLLEEKENLATRNISGEILKKLTKDNQNLIGGSADLSASTKVKANALDFEKDNPSGRNIMFGVREHAMGAIANGLALTGFLRPFVSGFFVFSDYLKPAIRMSALMGLPVIYLFTHDSIYVGEDGPTHQPIEQIDGLRAIPNLRLYRPANKYEVIKTYELALKDKKRPSVVVLTRQNLPDYQVSKDILKGTFKGFYTLDNEKDCNFIIYATGSEVSLAVLAKEILKEKLPELKINIISILSLKDFLEENIKTNLPSVAIEASSGISMYQVSSNVYKLNSFGLSAPGSEVAKKLKFTPNDFANYIIELVKGDKK